MTMKQWLLSESRWVHMPDLIAAVAGPIQITAR